MKIKQGDAYSVPIQVKLNGEPLVMENVETVEFYIGGYRKLYPSEVTYDTSDGYFYIPVTQEETFSWTANSPVMLDARVKFIGGNVQGIEKPVSIGVVDAVSEEVL